MTITSLRSTPSGLAVAPGWDLVPAWKVLRPVKRQGHTTETVLSVYRDHGVLPKASRSDNHNRTPENLDTYQLVEEGDVVFNKMKAWSGSVGVSPHRGIVSGDYMVCRVTPGIVDSRFLHYLLRSRPLFQEYARRSVGIRTSQWRLYWDALSLLDFAIPPLPTQGHIADFLDAASSRVDPIIDSQLSALDLVDERCTAVVYHAVKDEPGKVTPLRYLGRYVNGFPFKPEDKGDEGLPIVRIVQLLDPDAAVDRYESQPDPYCHIDTGDLIFSWSATLAARIWDRGPAYLNQHLFKVTPAEGIDRRWLRYALEAAVHDLDPYMHGSTMTHITRPMMSLVGVPVPTLERQREIVARIEHELGELAAFRSTSERQIDLLRERHQTTISAAVSGQLGL